MRGIGAVAVPFERVMRRIERLHPPVEVARDERDLGFGDRRSVRGQRLPAARRRWAARRSSVLARARSPSCAIAMPRSASAGGSSRKAM